MTRLPNAVLKPSTQLVALYGDAANAAVSTKRGGGRSGTGSTTTTTSSPSVVTSSSTGLVINISWDSSVSSAPAAFTAAVTSAVQYLESQILTPVAVNISVGWGEVYGSTLGSSTLGASESYLYSYSYSSLLNALTSKQTSTTDASAVASLTATQPVNGTLWATGAQAKALGLMSATSTATDAFIGFSNTLPFTFNDSTGVASGTYDFNGVALHELTETLGRLMFDGSTVGSTASSYSLLDLFHYSAPGARDFSAATPGYISVDGGQTSLGTLNTQSGGDPGDWSSSVVNDSFDAFSNSGVINAMSPNDLTELDAIGWTLAGAAPTASPTPTPTPTASTPTGVSFAALIGPSSIATASQVGGSTSDTYKYTIGGASASLFSLTNSSNQGLIAIGPAGLAGSTSGQLYALTITATDTTSGNSSPAAALDVIVSTQAADTIPVASLSSSLGMTTPTFVYGLGGNDKINGAGMTGSLWVNGGTGADTMTGGSGINDYLFTATSDSTASTMDVITNFNAASDLIDFTAINTSLKIAGAIGGRKLAGDSIGWQTSGGNTYVYVNTGSKPVSLTSSSMKIELQGAIGLSSGNFLHH